MLLKYLGRVLVGVVLLFISNTLYFRYVKSPGIASQSFLPLQNSEWLKLNDDMIKRFQTALRFETVSRSETDQNLVALANLTNFLLQSYPLIHSSKFIRAEFVSKNSLLYTITGTDSSLVPFLLAAHTDVVPVDNQNWDNPPFQGDIIDGFIYGRGTMDNKQSVLGILEALESLLRDGFKPKRSFFIAFGHDEELGGNVGAINIVKLLQSRGIKKLEFVLDEGNMVIGGLVPQYDLALIGVTERKHLVLEYSVEYPGGHASLPDSESSIGILSRAMSKLEQHKFPGWCGYGSETAAVQEIGAYFGFLGEAVAANFWLIAPILNRYVTSHKLLNSACRTTRALTMFHAGFKENVLADRAVAVIDHRVHPFDTDEYVIETDRAVIGDDRVRIKNIKPDPTVNKLADYGPDAFGYQLIRSVTHSVFTNAIVAPLIFPAVSDGRHYVTFTNNIYRFSGFYCESMNDTRRVHGANERISLKNYEQIINMHRMIILNSHADLQSPVSRDAHGSEF